MKLVNKLLLVTLVVGVAALAVGELPVTQLTPDFAEQVKTWRSKLMYSVVGAYDAKKRVNGGKTHRFFHAKDHGAYYCTFQAVNHNAKYGIFDAAHGKRDCVLRLSSGDPEIKPDDASDLKGWALKIDFRGANVGARNKGMDDKGDEHSHDIIMATGEPFFFRAPRDVAALTYESAQKVNAQAKGVFEGWFKIHNLLDTGAAFAKALLLSSHWVLLNIYGAKEAGTKLNYFDIEAVHSQTPYLFNGQAVRYKAVPRLVGTKVHTFDKDPRAIRKNTWASVQAAEEGAAQFLIYARFPGKDDDWRLADKKWEHAQSKLIAVVRLHKKRLTNEETESLSFNVWRGFEANRPLGGINALRGVLYHRAGASRVNTHRTCPFASAASNVAAALSSNESSGENSDEGENTAENSNSNALQP
eukprot:TRINITY_DN66614_c2_g1_i1.p2 TRINITY_DN66614_c2_g1~~TRINITY_DN66614_c2_g1_i1.p2  ORF type:complete len:415 (-),score=284.91 TRINITY_DN66614_c2_g1_i1:279-1523(-)